MSELLALLSDGNSPLARRLRVKLQPRDHRGRWIPTGAKLFGGLSLPGGGSKRVEGRAIGGTATKKGEKNNVRMLVGKGYEQYEIPENTVLTVAPKNATLESKVKLDRDFLERKGIDPDLQHTLPKSLEKQPQPLADMKPEKADDLDIELATNGLSDEEDKDFRAEREAEPLAKLPPGLDSLEGQEVRDLVDGDSPQARKNPEDMTDAELINAYAAELGRSQRKTPAGAPFGKNADTPASDELSKRNISPFSVVGWRSIDSDPKPALDKQRAIENLNKSPAGLSDDELRENIKQKAFFAIRMDSNGEIIDPAEADREEAEKRGLELDYFGNDMSDSAVDDAIANISYGGDTPSLDDLIDRAKSPIPSGGQNVGFGDLASGDIVLVKGVPARFDSAKQRSNGNWDILVDLGDGFGPRKLGSSKDFPNGIPDGSLVRLRPASASPAPAAPTPTPTATPTSPAPKVPPKPVAKPTPKPTKPAATPKTPTPVPQNRVDDGSDIAPNSTPLKDMQKVKVAQLVDPNTGRPLFGKGRKPVEDPNAIYNALLENNPQAKVDKSGHIILERGDFTDNDGKKYKYEVAVAKTHGNQYIERYSFTDENGDTQTFYHFDYKDSFASIYGDKNGVYTFRDQLLGKQIPGKQPPTRDTLNYFGPTKNLSDRIRFFRGKKSAGSETTVDDLNKTSFKLLTPEEVVKKYLEGRAEKYNRSKQGRGTKLQSFVGNAYEAIEDGDMAIFEARMVQLLGRLPDTEESRELLLQALRRGISEKFNGTPRGRELSTLAINMRNLIMSEGFDLKDTERRPFASKDGKTIVQAGDKVRYWNNVGEWSIGEVTATLGTRKVGNKVYDDVVVVRFGDGSRGVLRAGRMDILGDTLDTDLNMHDKDSDSTEYKRNLKGQELRDERGFSYDFGDEKRQDDDNSTLDDDQVGSDADQDAGAPYLGSDGVAGSDPEPAGAEDPSTPEGNVGDFEAGDIWPDADGDRQGSFVEAQKVEAEDGTEAWAVIWLDDEGNEQLEIVELGENRSPK